MSDNFDTYSKSVYSFTKWVEQANWVEQAHIEKAVFESSDSTNHIAPTDGSKASVCASVEDLIKLHARAIEEKLIEKIRKADYITFLNEDGDLIVRQDLNVTGHLRNSSKPKHALEGTEFLERMRELVQKRMTEKNIILQIRKCTEFAHVMHMSSHEGIKTSNGGYVPEKNPKAKPWVSPYGGKRK